MSGMDTERALFLEAELLFARSSADRSLARLAFDGPLAEVNQRNAALSALGEAITRARARAYVWNGDLEQRFQDLRALGASALATARAESHQAAESLRPRVDRAVRDANNLAGADPLRQASRIESLAAECRSVEAELDAAERRVLEVVAPFVGGYDRLAGQVTKVHATLDGFATASFKLMPEENPVEIVKVTWDDPPDGRKREGILAWTDHRLRFEHHEETVVERTLMFFAARTELRRMLLMDVPIGALAGTVEGRRGVVFKDQLVTITYVPGPNIPQQTTFALHDTPAKELLTLIDQLRAGDIERGRYKGPMPTGSAVGVPVRWPEKCETCGAPLRPPVKGQTVVTCDYCNANHAVEFATGG